MLKVERYQKHGDGAVEEITVENDLAVQVVMIGSRELMVKLQHPSHRALWSRIGARVKLESDLE